MFLNQFWPQHCSFFKVVDCETSCFGIHPKVLSSKMRRAMISSMLRPFSVFLKNYLCWFDLDTSTKTWWNAWNKLVWTLPLPGRKKDNCLAPGDMAHLYITSHLFHISKIVKIWKIQKIPKSIRNCRPSLRKHFGASGGAEIWLLGQQIEK